MKLHGHWIAKRTGILAHYKCMTMAEIILFDVYLLLANKESWECWLTVKQLMEILPIKKDTILRAKKGLLNKGWIQRVNRTGVFIPKLFRYIDSESRKVDNIDQKVDNIDQETNSNIQKVDNIDQTVDNIDQKVGNIDQKVDNIDLSNNKKNKNNILFKNSENAGLGNLLESDSARHSLHLLKSIQGYPFDYKKDLTFIQDLLIDFPSADINSNIKDWKVWLLDNPLKGKINYRSRLRKWIQNSIRYKSGKGYGKIELNKDKADRKGFDLPSNYPID